MAILIFVIGHIFVAHLSSCSTDIHASYPPIRHPIRRDKYFDMHDVFDSFSLRSTEYSEIYEKYEIKHKDGDIRIETYDIISLHAPKVEDGERAHVGIAWRFNHNNNTYRANIVCDRTSKEKVKHLINNVRSIREVRYPHINDSCIRYDMFDADIVKDIAFNYGDGCDDNIIGKLFGERSYIIAKEAFFSYIMTECINNARESISESTGDSYPFKDGTVDNIHYATLLSWISASNKYPRGDAAQCSVLAEYEQGISKFLERIPLTTDDFRAINLPTCDEPWIIFRRNTKEEYLLTDYILDDTVSVGLKSARMIVSVTDFDEGHLTIYASDPVQATPQDIAPLGRTFDCNDVHEENAAEDYHSYVVGLYRGHTSPKRRSSKGNISNTGVAMAYEAFYVKWKMACEAKKNKLSDPGNVVDPFYLNNEEFGVDSREDVENKLKKLIRHITTDDHHIIYEYKGENINEDDIVRRIMGSTSHTYSYSDPHSKNYLTLIEFHAYIYMYKYHDTWGRRSSSPPPAPSDAMLIISATNGESAFIIKLDCAATEESNPDNTGGHCSAFSYTSEEYTRENGGICGHSIGQVYSTFYGSLDSQIADRHYMEERIPYGNREREEREKFIRHVLADGLCHKEAT